MMLSYSASFWLFLYFVIVETEFEANLLAYKYLFALVHMWFSKVVYLWMKEHPMSYQGCIITCRDLDKQTEYK